VENGVLPAIKKAEKPGHLKTTAANAIKSNNNPLAIVMETYC
jgi:hypothetical protein